MPLSILITGINGTVGKHVARALLETKQYSVVGVGLRPACAIDDPALSYVRLDIREPDLVTAFLRSHAIDVILHFAALVHVRDPRLTFSDYLRLNYLASEHLFRTAIHCGASRLLFASTIEVYGPTCGDLPVAEDAECSPDSEYSRSKLLAEQSLMQLAAAQSVTYAILRLAPIYAHRFRLNLNKRIYLGKSSVGYMLCEGSYRIHLCSLRNIDHWILKWLQLPSPVSGVYNVADPIAYSAREVLEFERTHHQASIVVPLPIALCLAALSVRRAVFDVLGRDVGMYAPSNVSKLVRSTVWDTRKTEQLLGRLPGDLPYDLYTDETDDLTPDTSTPPSYEGSPAVIRQSAYYEPAKRALDAGLASLAGLALALPLAIAAVAVWVTSPGPILYWSRRIGRDNREFLMPKLRTMRVDTPQLATHLLTDSRSFITPVGRFLRKISLDEVPQLWSILVGDMSFVGPRPALYNQDDLIRLRTERFVHRLVPGLTGWAQINGRDELPIPVKVDYDVYYAQHRSLLLDFKIVLLTLWKVLTAEGIEH